MSLCSCGFKIPTWQEQYDLGVHYLEESNYEEAIIAFSSDIEIDPKQTPAYGGDAYIGSGEAEENFMAAQVDYEKAIELGKIGAEIYMKLADIHITLGNTDAAITILEQGYGTTGDTGISDMKN